MPDKENFYKAHNKPEMRIIFKKSSLMSYYYISINSIMQKIYIFNKWNMNNITKIW